MKVPVNPRTRVPIGQLGYQQAVDASSGTRALGEVVSRYAASIEEDNKKRELFDVQKMLVDETNNIQLDFEEKVKIQPLGAPNFTEQVNGTYNTRHAEMVEGLRTRGYSEDAVQEFATRLGTIRSQYVAKAIDFQDKSAFAKVVGDTEQLTVSLSQYANKNPNAVGSALNELRVALQHSGLDEIEQDKIYENRKNIILQGAREGFALQHPEVVLGMYGLPTELVTTSPPNLPHGQQFDLKTYMGKMGIAEGTGKNPKSSAVGHFQFLDSTMVETYKKVFGNTGETEAQILAKRKNLGVMTKLAEKFTGDNIQRLVDADLPVNDATVYLSHFLGVNDAIKVISAHADQTISKLVTPASVRANPGVFKKIKTADDLLEWARGKMGVAEEQVVESNYGDIARLAAPGSRAAAIGASSEVSAPYYEEPAAPTVDSPVKTGIPILDLSTGPERMQMLTTARTIMKGREADAKAQQQENHETWLNDFLNGLQDGKLGQADLNKAYSTGLLRDYDERKKAQGILDSKVKKETDLQRFGMMLRSGQKFNPYDDDAQKAVDAGFEKAVEFSQKNATGADPFVIALRAWQRTGILPKAGATMLRGGLIGTDPKIVATAASVASNMLKENPNAFAGVEGGDEIGKAAANYAHYVDDLGLTADQAAQKIALQNSPEFQAKVNANAPARTAFQTKLIGNAKTAGVDVEKIINDSVLGSAGPGGLRDLVNWTTRGRFTAPQLAEAKQTFTELALDHYDRYNDPQAAQAYASRQITRFYGVEGGRLLKFPASKAYPEIAGSREYLFDQAKELVDQFTGLKVPKEDVFLQPTGSGSTAAAFRAGRAVPYEVHYITRENGQAVYHFIPGKVFIADIDRARRDAAKNARRAEQSQRAARRALANVGRMR